MRNRGRQRNRQNRHRRSYRFRGLAGLAILIIYISMTLTPLLFAEDRVAEGAKDIAKGVASVPKQIAETSNESNIINGLVVGTAKGLLSTMQNIGEGLYRFLTFNAKSE